MTNGWPHFEVVLMNRGTDIERVRLVEVGVGGDPQRSVPYVLAKFHTRAEAEALVGELQAAGAGAGVQEALNG